MVLNKAELPLGGSAFLMASWLGCWKPMSIEEPMARLHWPAAEASEATDRLNLYMGECTFFISQPRTSLFRQPYPPLQGGSSMKKETRDTFILLVAISLSLVCDCGLLIAELASDIPRWICRCPSFGDMWAISEASLSVSSSSGRCGRGFQRRTDATWLRMMCAGLCSEAGFRQQCGGLVREDGPGLHLMCLLQMSALSHSCVSAARPGLSPRTDGS